MCIIIIDDYMNWPLNRMEIIYVSNERLKSYSGNWWIRWVEEIGMRLVIGNINCNKSVNQQMKFNQKHSHK